MDGFINPHSPCCYESGPCPRGASSARGTAPTSPGFSPSGSCPPSPIWPALAHRIPAMEELKLTGGWAGYYDCNRLDNNAVVGKHPKFDNVYLATGFTGRGLMQAPGIGRALTELITTGAYQSIDISNMAVERVLGKKARPEPYVL